LVLVGPLFFLTAPNAKVVVIDNGSGLCKASLCENQNPTIVMPAAIDHKYLINRGVIMDWEKLVFLLFEKFSVRGIYVELASVLSLLPIAHTPGIDVE
jgi:actin-related protein